MTGWGTREEKLRWLALHLIRNVFPPEIQRLCQDKEVIDDIMEIHDAVLEDTELDIMLGSCTPLYVEKVDKIKREVMQRLKEEALT